VSIALGSAPACKRKEQAPPEPVPSAQSTADHLAKGEIPEGRERAFSLPLPLHSTIKARFANSVHVASPYTQEELANFIKTRVKDGKTTSGASETRFDQVVVVKDPSKTLTIQVRPAPIMGEFRSQVVVDDVTPLPEEPGLTDADRWKKAGMSPDGKLLDRKHLQ
jgi:hypothetical protein